MDHIEKRAASMGLRFAASRSFVVDDEAPRGLRIGFASLSEEEARTAIFTLASAAG